MSLNHVTYKLNGNFIFIFPTISEEHAIESTALLFGLDFNDNIFSKICAYFNFTLLEMVNNHDTVQEWIPGRFMSACEKRTLLENSPVIWFL